MRCFQKTHNHSLIYYVAGHRINLDITQREKRKSTCGDLPTWNRKWFISFLFEWSKGVMRLICCFSFFYFIYLFGFAFLFFKKKHYSYFDTLISVRYFFLSSYFYYYYFFFFNVFVWSFFSMFQKKQHKI